MFFQRGLAGQDTQTACQDWGQECLQGFSPLPVQLWGRGLIGSTLKLFNSLRQTHSVAIALPVSVLSVSPDFLLSPVGAGGSVRLGDCSKPPGPQLLDPLAFPGYTYQVGFQARIWEKEPLASSLPRMPENQAYFFSLRSRVMEGKPGIRQDLCGPWHLQSTVAHTCNWKLRQEFPATGYKGRPYRP